jgi:hypothetical protein
VCLKGGRLAGKIYLYRTYSTIGRLSRAHRGSPKTIKICNTREAPDTLLS